MRTSVPTRRFGRTELPMPLLSLGGMRFQQSWSDLKPDEIQRASQTNLQATLERAAHCGLHHVGRHAITARPSDKGQPSVRDPERILRARCRQDDAAAFEAELELSSASRV